LGKIYVSQSVKRELISDVDRFDDAKILKGNIKNNLINISDFETTNRFSNLNLGIGEKDTIEICLEEEGILITDDHKALNLALGIGLKPKTSEIILLDFLKKSIITYEVFQKSFWALARIKNLNSEIISFIFDKAEEIIKNKNQK
jgi:predicted nucleic acid-binding protein